MQQKLRQYLGINPTEKQERICKLASSSTMASILCAVLAGCGGGESQSATSPENTSRPVPVLSVDCEQCAALDSHHYRGSGIGIWKWDNRTGVATELPVEISGLAGQDVTVVLTNESSSGQVLSNVHLTPAAQWMAGMKESEKLELAPPQILIQDFNQKNWRKLTDQSRPAVFSKELQEQPIKLNTSTHTVNQSTRAWWHMTSATNAQTFIGKDSATTLRGAFSAHDGSELDIWVEDTEFGDQRVSPEMVIDLGQSFMKVGGIYEKLVSLGGPLWGQVPYSNMIDRAQAIHIVLTNLENHSGSPRLLGYFWGGNNFRNPGGIEGVDRNCTSIQTRCSNEALSIYLDAPAFYEGGNHSQKMMSALAHEAMHMQNFYRRAASRSSRATDLAGSGKCEETFEPWLEEGTAMMAEDLLDADFYGVNAIAGDRLPDYFRRNADKNYSLVNSVEGPTSLSTYAATGAFGAFLNRQLGSDLLRQLLTDFSDCSSVRLLDHAIHAISPHSSVGEELRRWATTTSALLPGDNSPVGYGYKSRHEVAFALPEINLQSDDFRKYRTDATTTPSLLAGYASFPFIRKAMRGTYQERVTVPAETSLTVVIQ